MASVFVLALMGACASAFQAPPQALRVGIVDFYGLRTVTETQARLALAIREGDSIQGSGGGQPESLVQAERRLVALPRVVSARVNAVCCEAGDVILYVGIEELGAPTLRVRAAPTGSVRLAAELIQAGQEFSRALMQAVRRGDAGEDDSKGHSLMHDPAARAVQERFIGIAARHFDTLRDVLRTSSDASHRALAAQILGYAADKREIVGDLSDAMADASEQVRNNAMRSLAVIASFAWRTPALKIHVSPAPFVDLLNSAVWTDRNKASMALADISESRDPELLAAMRSRALPSLVEMTRWKSDGHAGMAFWLLGRIAGMSESDIGAAWDKRDREAVIAAALR